MLKCYAILFSLFIVFSLQSVVVTPDPSLTKVGAGLEPKSKLPGISSSEAAANWLKSAQTETAGGGASSSAVQKAAVSTVSINMVMNKTGIIPML